MSEHRFDRIDGEAEADAARREHVRLALVERRPWNDPEREALQAALADYAIRQGRGAS